jgi:acetyltransferase-like isoleucine patch superfamily enzyme
MLQQLLKIFVRLKTKLEVCPTAKVRWSSLLRAKSGIIKIGKQSIVNCKIVFDEQNGQVIIGKRCYIGASLIVCHSLIHIGDDVIISWGVTIVDHDSHSIYWSNRCGDVLDWASGKKQWENVNIRPVHIEEKVWIGFGASILKGVRVGRGAVIGAGSIVTNDVPPYTVVAGNPAKEIRVIEDGNVHSLREIPS